MHIQLGTVNPTPLNASDHAPGRAFLYGIGIVTAADFVCRGVAVYHNVLGENSDSLSALVVYVEVDSEHPIVVVTADAKQWLPLVNDEIRRVYVRISTQSNRKFLSLTATLLSPIVICRTPRVMRALVMRWLALPNECFQLTLRLSGVELLAERRNSIRRASCNPNIAAFLCPKFEM